jgi:hypothetical protein
MLLMGYGINHGKLYGVATIAADTTFCLNVCVFPLSVASLPDTRAGESFLFKPLRVKFQVYAE